MALLTKPVLSRQTMLAEVALILVSAGTLLAMGRALACRCGKIALWSGNIWSDHNSQELADPYSFTHITHGVLFFWGLRMVAGRLSVGTRLILATVIEAAWEITENTDFVINRYREATISLDYYGDSVINSMSDIGTLDSAHFAGAAYSGPH